MTVNLTPYLNFRGTAKQALEFYGSALGGEPTFTTFAEGGMTESGMVDPSEGEQIMHGQLKTPSGFLLMGADVPQSMEYATGNNSYSVSLSGDDEEQLRGYWDRLSSGATITAPLERAPWGDVFGMCIDKFGVNWLINIAGQA